MQIHTFLISKQVDNYFWPDHLQLIIVSLRSVYYVMDFSQHSKLKWQSTTPLPFDMAPLGVNSQKAMVSTERSWANKGIESEIRRDDWEDLDCMHRQNGFEMCLLRLSLNLVQLMATHIASHSVLFCCRSIAR